MARKTFSASSRTGNQIPHSPTPGQETITSAPASIIAGVTSISSVELSLCLSFSIFLSPELKRGEPSRSRSQCGSMVWPQCCYVNLIIPAFFECRFPAHDTAKINGNYIDNSPARQSAILGRNYPLEGYPWPLISSSTIRDLGRQAIECQVSS